MATKRERISNPKDYRKLSPSEWTVRFVDYLKKHTDEEHPLHTIADIKGLFDDMRLCAGAENTIRKRLREIAEAYNTDENERDLPQSEWRINFDGYKEQDRGEDVSEENNDTDSEKKDVKLGSYKGIYYIPEFSYEQIDTIIEAVQFSRTISGEEADKIISTLEEKFVSEHYKKKRGEHRVCKVYEKAACDREHLRENLLTIQQAIQDNVQISYRFNGYTHDKKLAPMRDYTRKDVSPYYIVADNGRYFLLAANEKYRNAYIIRIDLMTDVQIQNRTEETRGDKRLPISEVAGMPIQWDPEYPLTHVNMSYGEPIRAKLRIFSEKDKDGKHIDPDYTFLHDHFGDTYQFWGVDKTDPNYDIVRVKSPEFGIVNFALRYADKVEVLSPPDVREQIRGKVEMLMEKYLKPNADHKAEE